MNDIYAVILAAGEGKRMKSRHSKVLQPICGRTMVEHALEAVSDFCKKPILVVGHDSEAVKAKVGDRAFYAEQKEQLGTGHAVMTARSYLEGKQGYVVVMAGDMPLIQKPIINHLVQEAREGTYCAVVLTSRMKDPTGYGRIIRGLDGTVKAIIEEKDAQEQEKAIEEVNSSIYCFEIPTLLSCLDNLKNDNAQQEYYLTDCIAMMANMGKKVRPVCIPDGRDCMGVNDREQLAEATTELQKRIIAGHLKNGVTFIDPDNAYVDIQVTIANDVVIYPGVVLQGNTQIGCGCTIYPGTVIRDSIIGSEVTIRSSELEECVVEDSAKIGPFAHIRPNSRVGRGCKLGNFVEIKNSTLDEGSKVSHLTYVGDADVGKHTNIGCGVVFVNYDGANKYRTTVGDNAFIGCNTNLVAPVQVGDGAYTAAGSTITDDVPENTLAVARNRQVNKPGWNRPRKK